GSGGLGLGEIDLEFGRIAGKMPFPGDSEQLIGQGLALPGKPQQLLALKNPEVGADCSGDRLAANIAGCILLALDAGPGHCNPLASFATQLDGNLKSRLDINAAFPSVPWSCSQIQLRVFQRADLCSGKLCLTFGNAGG